MTTTTDADLHPCLCGCGELVTGKYKRGHWARTQSHNARLQPLPGPADEVPDEDDDDELPPELVAELDNLDWIDAENARATPESDEPAGEDPAPSRLRQRRQTPAAPKRTRVTATMQRDVQAKIRMVLVPAGRVWAMRDTVCGPVFVEQEPDISEALAEIVCDSPDLLNWFTGPAGGYMKYFKLLMAVQPVLLVLWMHHIAHADQSAEPAQPQQPAFAA
jgi:hypothetical protein